MAAAVLGDAPAAQRKRRRGQGAQDTTPRFTWQVASSWGASVSENKRKRDASKEFVQHLLLLYATGALSAKDLCILCHHAHGAGLEGDVELYAMKPGQSSAGNYQQHLDRVLPKSNAPTHYYLEVPVCARRSLKRSTREVPVVPLYEALAAEVAAAPPSQEQVLNATSEWAHLARRNRLFANAPVGADLYLLALYVDGVRFTRGTLAGHMDTFIGFTLRNLITGKRHLVCLLRKSELCRCGCRGWCTVYPVMEFLAWGVRALARGQRPGAMHDDSPWPADDSRRALAGTRLTPALFGAHSGGLG